MQYCINCAWWTDYYRYYYGIITTTITVTHYNCDYYYNDNDNEHYDYYYYRDSVFEELLALIKTVMHLFYCLKDSSSDKTIHQHVEG